MCSVVLDLEILDSIKLHVSVHVPQSGPQDRLSQPPAYNVSHLPVNRMQCPVQCASTGSVRSPGEGIERCAHVGSFNWEWWAGTRDQPHMDGNGFSSDPWTNETMVSRLHIDNTSAAPDERPNVRSL
jgi:hypothetical protein